MNELTLDALYSGELLTMTFNPNTALGTSGTVNIYGNKLAGRIVITTGTGSDGFTVGTVLFPEGNGLATDNAFVFIESLDGKFFQVAQGETTTNGFEIVSKELWQDNTTYEFKYFIISHVQ